MRRARVQAEDAVCRHLGWMRRPAVQRTVAFVVDEVVATHVRWRGGLDATDGRLTLLTVNWNTEPMLDRLLRSFRRFVGTDLPIVVVDNSPGGGAASSTRAHGGRYVTTGVNLGHGLGLDLGLRSVTTEYVLVCDPDTVVLSPQFVTEVTNRLTRFGVAGVDTGNAYYHPLCVAFPTEHWKAGVISMQERFPYWDVGGALTHLLGGVHPEALIPKSRSFGPPLLPALGGHDRHYLGEVYGDVFSSTYLAARLELEPERQEFDGWSRAMAVDFHERWSDWADAVLRGSATVADFPVHHDGGHT